MQNYLSDCDCHSEIPLSKFAAVDDVCFFFVSSGGVFDVCSVLKAVELASASGLFLVFSFCAHLLPIASGTCRQVRCERPSAWSFEVQLIR